LLTTNDALHAIFNMRFDVAVVGAGPAGLAAAYRLASRGFRVVVLERGKYPGSKQVSGARIYTSLLDTVFPEYKEGPIERWVVEERIYVSACGKESVAVFRLSESRYSFTTHISRFVSWMGKLAEAAGVVLATSVLVEGLVWRNGRVVGVRSGKDVIESDVVILAEGGNRLISESHGIARGGNALLGVKEVWRVDTATINKVLGLGDDEGVAWTFVGDVTRGMPGGAFLYTMRNSISLGVVIDLNHVERLGTHAHELLNWLKSHRDVASLIKGGEMVEYSAKTVKIGGEVKVVGPGYLVIGEAGGAMLHGGLIIRGVDLAIASGVAAAEAIAMGKPENYPKMAKPINEVLRRFSGSEKLFKDPKIFGEFPCDAMSALARFFEQRKPTRLIPTLAKVAIRHVGEVLKLLTSL